MFKAKISQDNWVRNTFKYKYLKTEKTFASALWISENMFADSLLIFSQNRERVSKETNLTYSYPSSRCNQFECRQRHLVKTQNWGSLKTKHCKSAALTHIDSGWALQNPMHWRSRGSADKSDQNILSTHVAR